MKALDFLVNLKQSRDFDGNLESSLDEAIAELEEMQQPKTCEGCKYGTMYVGTDRKYCECGVQQDGLITVDSGFCCNRHKPKEQ